MSFSQETIAKIAELARLGFKNTEDLAKIQVSLGNIVKMVDQIKLANVDDVQTMAHPLELPQPLRQDAVTEPDQSQDTLKLAPQKEANLFIVPPVIE